MRQLIQVSWAGDLLHPEDLYYKVLAEYFRLTLEGMDVEADDNPMLEVMTDFQVEAYQYAKGILRRFGGVFLADVVGLGKTFIGLALLRYLQDRFGQHPVVIAPPAVCPAWEALAAEFRIELQTVSHGKLEDLERHQGREVLVIDESHNFRNTDTRRYETLLRWLTPDGVPSDRKVILISATPQNNRPRDVLHQLRLFPTGYSRLPYRGESLDGFFQSVESGRDSMTSLLQHVVVRRTRRFIRAEYPDAQIRRPIGPGRSVSEPLRFPLRVSGPEQCLRYVIEQAYAGLYEQVMQALRRMYYPLYGMVTYVLPQHAGHPQLAGVTRSGRSLRGLFKVLLLKRLESSVEAFRRTLGRLQERLEEALRLLEQGQVRVRRSARGDSNADDDRRDLDAQDECLLPAHMFRQPPSRRAFARRPVGGGEHVRYGGADPARQRRQAGAAAPLSVRAPSRRAPNRHLHTVCRYRGVLV